MNPTIASIDQTGSEGVAHRRDLFVVSGQTHVDGLIFHMLGRCARLVHAVTIIALLSLAYLPAMHAGLASADRAASGRSPVAEPAPSVTWESLGVRAPLRSQVPLGRMT